jgi:methyl-accepting chemotaxis protein
MAGAFTRMIGGIKAQAKVVESIAAGDLRVTVTPRSERDIINIGLRDMLETNNEVFSEINRSAENVSSGAKQVADGSQSLAQATTEQAAVVEELAGSISEVSEKTARNASMAQEASKLGQSINGNAARGNTQMSNMMQAVREINEASQSISKVIKAIDDIAFQTNILALNAAVEAARAGQHGKGFAVVAEEVRSLAAKSAEAAKDTGGLIVNSIEKAELGARIAQETAQSLAEIVEGIQQSGAIVADIARLSDEQAAAISQINKGIDQVSQVVQTNSATAEESAAASEEMSSQSVVLSELVSRFKLKESSRPAGHMSSLSQKVSAPRRPGTAHEDADDLSFQAVGGFGKY